jgi:hypothetical protein
MKAAFLILLLQLCLFFNDRPVNNMVKATDESPDFAQQLPVDPDKKDTFLEDLLKKYPAYFSNILQNKDSLKVQIIYTQIDRDAQNNPSFKNYYFNVDSNKYFYPASTIKLPLALLALQKINELRLPDLNKNSTLITENGYSGQTAVYNDPTTVDGRPTVANYVKKIFLVSDNDACNRLYEFLGQEYINQQLKKMGYADAQILHRLSIALTEDENRHTNPIGLYNNAGRILYQQPMQISQQKYISRNDFLGKAYYNNSNQLINQPMNFSKKNRICLEDLHNILRSVLFPNSVPVNQRFNLKDEDYQFVYQYMSQYPPETIYPPYDSTNYWDAFGKFLYWGSEKATLPKNIRIFNKEGDAYGFLTDVSYFADFDKHVEFMLSATIYCNSNGILNDDKYDYDTVGLPFMKQLGRIIYEYELKRKRNYQPNLSRFRLKYDK